MAALRVTTQRVTETIVGLFVILALIAFSILAIKVSGLSTIFPKQTYQVSASFDDIGGLRIRAPVKIGGVQVGEVSRISLDPVTFKANVMINFFQQYNNIPDDSSAGIYTSGLLGDNYIAITPMYNSTFLKNGSHITMTNSAMVLEKIIGQFMYNAGKEGNKH